MVSQLKTINTTQLEHLMLAHPAAKLRHEGDRTFVEVPTFDLVSGESGGVVMEVVGVPVDVNKFGMGPQAISKLQPGDVIKHSDGTVLHVKSVADFIRDPNPEEMDWANSEAKRLGFQVRDGAEPEPKKTESNSLVARLLSDFKPDASSQ